MVAEVVTVPDILIRGLSAEEVEALTTEAERLGLSRNEYVKRSLLGQVRADLVYAEHQVGLKWSWSDLRELTDDLSHDEIERLSRGSDHFTLDD